MRKENLVEMWVTAPNEKDRDAFMSEWALTESWGLMIQLMEMNLLSERCAVRMCGMYLVWESRKFENQLA